jgi:hypothetical protein
MALGTSGEQSPFIQDRVKHSKTSCKQQNSVQWKGRLRVSRLALLAYAIALLGVSVMAQTSDPLPFAVSNPKHLEWSTEQAARIYASACELVARAIRPENPPRLAPKFLLVLGTAQNETLRNGRLAEVHLTEWNAERFAEAMVLMASREIIKNDDLANLTRDTMIAAQASVTVSELKQKK